MYPSINLNNLMSISPFFMFYLLLNIQFCLVFIDSRFSLAGCAHWMCCSECKVQTCISVCVISFFVIEHNKVFSVVFFYCKLFHGTVIAVNLTT